MELPQLVVHTVPMKCMGRCLICVFLLPLAIGLSFKVHRIAQYVQKVSEGGWI